MTSFLLDGLQNNTVYEVQVTSYGDRRFFDSAPEVATVRTDNNGKELVEEFRKERDCQLPPYRYYRAITLHSR